MENDLFCYFGSNKFVYIYDLILVFSAAINNKYLIYVTQIIYSAKKCKYYFRFSLRKHSMSKKKNEYWCYSWCACRGKNDEKLLNQITQNGLVVLRADIHFISGYIFSNRNKRTPDILILREIAIDRVKRVPHLNRVINLWNSNCQQDFYMNKRALGRSPPRPSISKIQNEHRKSVYTHKRILYTSESLRQLGSSFSKCISI